MKKIYKQCGTAVSAVSFSPTGGTPVLHSFVPFSPYSLVESTHRNLPHWQQAGTTYFLTFRLADSLPKKKLDTLKKQREGWLLLNPEPWNELQQKEYSRLFCKKVNEWLDAGEGDCILAQSAYSEIVENALKHFDRCRYVLDEYVVMPNHVHILLSPLGKYKLGGILHTLKSFTAHKINRQFNRQGSVWMDESYDHIVRSPEQLKFYQKYIRENPAKARLSSGQYRQKQCSTAVSAVSFSFTGGTPVLHSELL